VLGGPKHTDTPAATHKGNALIPARSMSGLCHVRNCPHTRAHRDSARVRKSPLRSSSGRTYTKVRPIRKQVLNLDVSASSRKGPHVSYMEASSRPPLLLKGPGLLF